MDIYERILQDHDLQRELADKLMNTSGDSEERAELWARFKVEAEAHANAEEQTFYAALIADPEVQEQARHSVAEHKEASDLIEELSDLDFGSGGWLQKFEKLKEALEHHMDEEEEDVFEMARASIPADEAETMVEEFDKRKSAEEAEMKAA